MQKGMVIGALGLGLLALSPKPATAQVPLVVKQGDTIVWVAASDPGRPHRVRFGGDANGRPLTTLQDIENKFLEGFTPALTKNPAGTQGLSTQSADGELLRAKVKDNAPVDGQFTFTCNVHPNAMRSKPWKVAAKDGGPAQTHVITGNAELQWIWKAPNGSDVPVGGD